MVSSRLSVVYIYYRNKELENDQAATYSFHICPLFKISWVATEII